LSETNFKKKEKEKEKEKEEASTLLLFTFRYKRRSDICLFSLVFVHVSEQKSDESGSIRSHRVPWTHEIRINARHGIVINFIWEMVNLDYGCVSTANTFSKKGVITTRT